MVERRGDRHLKGRVGGGCSWEGTLYPRALWRVHSQHSGFLFPVGERSAGNTRYVCFVLLECFPLLKKPVRVKQQALFSWLISPLGRGNRECKPCLDHQQHASSGGRKRCIDDLINKTNQEREMIKCMPLPLLKEFLILL